MRIVIRQERASCMACKALPLPPQWEFPRWTGLIPVSEPGYPLAASKAKVFRLLGWGRARL